jgi:hypothetical protein
MLRHRDWRDSASDVAFPPPGQILLTEKGPILSGFRSSPADRQRPAAASRTQRSACDRNRIEARCVMRAYVCATATQSLTIRRAMSGAPIAQSPQQCSATIVRSRSLAQSAVPFNQFIDDQHSSRPTTMALRTGLASRAVARLQPHRVRPRGIDEVPNPRTPSMLRPSPPGAVRQNRLPRTTHGYPISMGRSTAEWAVIVLLSRALEAAPSSTASRRILGHTGNDRSKAAASRPCPTHSREHRSSEVTVRRAVLRRARCAPRPCTVEP